MDEHPLLGEELIAAGLINWDQLQRALSKSRAWNMRLGDVLLSYGWVRPFDFYQVLARHFDVSFVNLFEEPADSELFHAGEYSDYAEHLFLPWRKRGNQLWLVVADPTSPWMQEHWGSRDDVFFVMTSSYDIMWELQRIASAHISNSAVHYLATTNPEHSAHKVVTWPQGIFLLLSLLLLVSSVWRYPLQTGITINALLCAFMLCSAAFRMVLSWISCSEEAGQNISEEELSDVPDTELPIYTILVPMYKESTVLPILANALINLDYPRAKLDIKLVLEEDDQETIDAAKALHLSSVFEIVRVPPSFPRTKPKACNYALRLVRGEYLTIYDAEDKPEPNQLKKVLAAFRRLGDRAACVQARLNYFNSTENWLTGMFTLEYSLWFDLFLPALDHLHFPIPLGGTSNHFDLKKLREVGGWDPYNVTEDADLGLRFTAFGYKVGVVNSVTYEEANSRYRGWIRQRSRWIKGYMQTWLVNMRNPFALIQKAGWKGFFSFQLFVGGTIVSALALPFMVIPFLLNACGLLMGIRAIFPPPVLAISLVNLLVCNGILLYHYALAAVKRGNHHLLLRSFTVPLYWVMQSIAGYKAFWQLISKPFYWEKTVHGVSNHTSAELGLAVAATQSVAAPQA